MAALEAIAGDRRVARAEEVVREASARLRWHEALRRRWREARAEASVRCAAASGGVDGVVVPVDVLREHVVAGLEEVTTGDPALDAVAGLWRAGSRVVGWMPDLVGAGRPSAPPARGLLAALHRDVTAPLAACGQIALEDVAAPRAPGALPREGGSIQAPQGEELVTRVGALIDMVDVPGAPALVRAAVVHAETAVVRPFTVGSAALGRLLARHLVTRDGLEPTGTAVTDLWAARSPASYAEALSAYASGSLDGVVSWVQWQAEAILHGLEEAESLCRAVQAGTWKAG
ncbi:cell filamentation protein Fic [Actinomyces sp. 2119]|uniref:Cell filamentation protein Fic n=1 Tax=Actinomyces lilanjuaniae TaxID=2321394 RepID=A0ABN5PRJ3_9ACTO|nr:cell filamentation protein Fic [Actinomyces lilanjuaniae]RJF44110.1 cell filamentation protein Fic [Actinomyces sp. 2119]